MSMANSDIAAKDLKDQNVLWRPNMGSQILFLSCPYPEVFYFGTRKVGKTETLLIDYLRDVGKGYGSNWRGLLFRKTFPQTRDAALNSMQLFKSAFPGAKYNGNEHMWTFPDGEILYFSYFDKPSDYGNYHGHFYPWIAWDELTEWPSLEGYHLMKSCNVAPVGGVPFRLRATGNTWGVGRSVVKRHFIDEAGNWGIPITDKETGRKRIAIYGDMLENIPFMRTRGKEFRDGILSMQDTERIKSWLGGSWDVSIGGFFADVWDSKRNIISKDDCFVPPAHWPCWRSFDWGSASPFSVGWWCESDGTEAPNGKVYPRGALIRFWEWYGNDKKARDLNTGLKMGNPDIGKGIRNIEKRWPQLQIRKGPADTQIFSRMGRESIHQEMGGNLFIEADKSPGSRITGLQQMRDRFRGYEDTGPMMLAMEWCADFIRTVPELQRDEKELEDTAQNQEDHIADEVRYMCLSRRVKSGKGKQVMNVADILMPDQYY